ncbi:hypothetical protein Slin15195_G021980 [Septoria linicola]|uniref:Uncharacterized protein n=1 Tax=Septoria linicola TaxID=215465 RepID=A0A9Q9AJ87_9PEZI|nr:hypothetical protein Slin14017_G130450 [Septoria linicola]USW48879.1 hypothetical protein Slin15195_G021980 [Septoria linicola]
MAEAANTEQIRVLVTAAWLLGSVSEEVRRAFCIHNIVKIYDLVVKLFDDIVNGKDDLHIQESDSEFIRDARKALLNIFQRWRDTHDDQLFDRLFRDTVIRYLQDNQLAPPLPDADRSERRACQLAGVIKQSVIAPTEAVYIKEIEALKRNNLEHNSKSLELQQARNESRVMCDAKQSALQEQTSANAVLAIEVQDQAKKLSEVEQKSLQHQEDNRTLVQDLNDASKTN